MKFLRKHFLTEYLQWLFLDYFENILQAFLDHIIIKTFKKKYEPKNQKTKMKLREKQEVILIFSNESLKKEEKKTSGFGKTIVEIQSWFQGV